MAEINKEEYEFERDIVKGAANARTGKANAEKVSKYLEDKLRAKVEIWQLICMCFVYVFYL